MANAEQKITMIPIAMMLESKFNPRQSFDEASQADLVSSIKEKGIITPLIVRPAGLEGEYEIIAGSRRFRAAQKLGIKELPAIVLELNDEQARELAITDNLHHKDVAPLDEAEGYFSLMKLSKRSIAGVAAKLGKPPEYIAGRLKLVDLSDRAKKALREDEITIGHALLLARLSKQDQDKIVARSKYSGIQTVNQLKRQIEEQFFLDLAKAPWSMDDANLFRAAGACKVCPKRSGFNKELFGDVQKRDICSDSQCYNLKLKAFLDLKRQEFARRKERFVEISTEYWTDNKKIPGTNDYRSPRAGCPKAVAGLVVHGKEIGTVRKVCIGPCETCNGAKHSSSSSGSTSSPQSRKERYARRMEIWENKIQQEYRTKLRTAVLPLVKGPLKRWHLLALLRETMEARHLNYGASFNDVAKLVGLKWPDVHRGCEADDIKQADKLLAKASDDQILRFIFAIATERDMIVDPSMGGNDIELLNPLLELHASKKVDAKKIEREARKSLESKKPKPPKPEKKTTKLHKPKGKKR